MILLLFIIILVIGSSIKDWAAKASLTLVGLLRLIYGRGPYIVLRLSWNVLRGSNWDGRRFLVFSSFLRVLKAFFCLRGVLDIETLWFYWKSFGLVDFLRTFSNASSLSLIFANFCRYEMSLYYEEWFSVVSIEPYLWEKALSAIWTFFWVLSVSRLYSHSQDEGMLKCCGRLDKSRLLIFGFPPNPPLDFWL